MTYIAGGNEKALRDSIESIQTDEGGLFSRTGGLYERRGGSQVPAN